MKGGIKGMLDDIVYSPSVLQSLRDVRDSKPREFADYSCDSNCDDGGCDAEGDIDSGCDQD